MRDNPKKNDRSGIPSTGYTTTINGFSISLECPPELFSPRRLDAGTRAMLNTVELGDDEKVLDLGCGCGVVGIYLASRLGEESVFLIDTDPLAVETSQKNATANGMPGLTVTQSDGFRSFTETGFTHILCNPPYHTDFSVARHFIMKGFNRLKLGGQMHIVVKRETWYRNKMRSVFGGSKCEQVDGYFVISATRRQDTYAQRR